MSQLTERRSREVAVEAKGLGALHLVIVWESERGLTPAQVSSDEKSNEITAIPELLMLIDLEGSVITIDAMVTQVQIAMQLVESMADYILSLKNHSKIRDAVIDLVDEHVSSDFRCKARATGQSEPEVISWQNRILHLCAIQSAGGFSMFGTMVWPEDVWACGLSLDGEQRGGVRDSVLSQQSETRCCDVLSLHSQPIRYRANLSLESGCDLSRRRTPFTPSTLARESCLAPTLHSVTAQATSCEMSLAMKRRSSVSGNIV